MDLRPGYKQTEVGVIPEDWEVKTLEESSDCLDNLRIPLNEAQRNQMKGDFPYCGANGILDYVNSYVVDDDIILIAEDGGFFDEYAYRPIAYRMNGKCWVNNHAHILKSKKDVNQGFLFYALVHKNILGFLTSGTRAKLNKSEMWKIIISIPFSPAEQSAIATVLSDTDSLIQSLEQLIAKKRLIKQGAMQELLTGKRRLPGFSGELEEKLISDFADCTAGGTPSTNVRAYWGGQIRWMSSGELNLKRVAEVNGRITEAGLANSSANLLPVNSVLIGLAGQGKTRGTVAMNLVELCTNQSIAAVLPNDLFVPEYLYFNLDARYDELRELSSGGGGRGGLNLKLIKSLEIPLPSVEEQCAIATVLSDMDAEITALESRLEKIRALKQGMMQELLTGRIRLV